MKYRKITSAVVGAALLTSMMPIVQVSAQTEPHFGTVRLAATRGAVEIKLPGQAWQNLRGSMDVPMGTAVRTGDAAECTASLNDGSTIALSDNGMMRVNGLAQHLNVKVLGNVAASMSPSFVHNGDATLELPMGRATIGEHVAMGRSVRRELASSLAATNVTMSGRQIKFTQTAGVALIQSNFNVQGRVAAVNPETHSFTLEEDATGRVRRLLVSPHTQIASNNSQGPFNQNVLGRLKPGEHLVAYGSPAVAEGPGDSDDPSVNVLIIYVDDGGDKVGADLFIFGPDIPAGNAGIMLTAGQVADITAGHLPLLLEGGAAGAGGAAAVGGVGATTLILGGLGVYGLVKILSNNGSSTPPPILFPASP